MRASVGDGLNDEELTRLLCEERLTEAGFGFLNFADGFVTLSVPPQDLANWYPDRGWIALEKERIAKAIAEKHQLSVFEPPDQNTSTLFPPSNPPEIHHHLELSNRWETVVVAHPFYLKVRLFGTKSEFLYNLLVHNPLELRADLLEDLCTLYQASRVVLPATNNSQEGRLTATAK